MKINKLTKVAMLGLVAASLASASALAQDVSANPTDLILGFQITDGSGQGSTENLEVDLGASSIFTTTATLTLNQLSTADLIATYGSSWASRGDLTWGVAGNTSQTADTFDVTYSGSTAPNTNTQSVLGQPHTEINGLWGALGNTTQTANSTQAGVVGSTSAPASGVGGSWSSLVGNNSLGDFGYFTQNASTEVDGGSGTTIGSIDLYGFAPASGRNAASTPAEELGVFDLSSTGVLTYTGIDAEAVPEPSAYALGICAVLLFLVLKRRHSVA